jgi:diguanylate cyclase
MDSSLAIGLGLLLVLLGGSCAAMSFRLRAIRAALQPLQARVTELESANAALASQAYFDPLTGLANRSLLADRFRLAVERARRNKTAFAVAMIDLNRFKEINDTHGHAAGDAALVCLGQRLVETVRASDTVARFGGDEFVLLIESVSDRRELGNLGLKLVDALSHTLQLPSGDEVNLGGSVGFGLYPTDGWELDDLLHVADQAMYEYKSSGLLPLFEAEA